MRVLEYGKEHEKTLLFLPCTAEPGFLCQFIDALDSFVQTCTLLFLYNNSIVT